MESKTTSVGEMPTIIKPNQCKEEESLVNFVQRVKLAVAVAVIKSTPEGTTPEDYARFLVETYSTDVDNWKEKCQKLEKDMFNIEQKLQMIQIKNEVNSQLPGYESWQEDVMTLTVPETFHENTAAQTNITDAIEFVKNFILLNSVSSTNCLPSNHCDDELAEKRCEVILKTVTNIFDYLRSEEGLRMEFDIAQRAVKEILGLFNVSLTKRNKNLIPMCLEFIDGLLVDIHRTIEINKVEDQHRRSILIQIVAEQKSLTILILCRLLREITLTSDFLENLFSPDNENFSPLLNAENAYYVLQSTEGVLKVMEQQNSSLNALKIPEPLLLEWDKTTKRSLAVLGVHFPMYCIYVWNLKATMKSLFVINQEED
ncbi:hypothetical protein AVEN_145540-1 [Araneus ventricosus]|uniref:Uncharacterized protein n=1 Tax=Araneus ventricosus TaxID=182803 RepID=A0A4Y2LDU6_ARAVE|nr:hypothetical protein AVEN_145540-1 [Araneus ventricosus]